MNAKVTYGQLDKVLRSLGFASWPTKGEPSGRVYKHKSGAMIILPTFEDDEGVYEHHLVAVRGQLDNFGISDPTAFAAKLQKAG